MLKPRPPHESARAINRLAKLAASLGMDFEHAAIGVSHDKIEPISIGLRKLTDALFNLGLDLQREAMTPAPTPEPAAKPTPILDFLERQEQAEAPPRPAEVVPAPMPERPGDGGEKKACDEPPTTESTSDLDLYVAFVGRNPQFYVEAYDEADAGIVVARVFPDRGFRFEAVTPQWAADRKLPCFQHWKEATIKEAHAKLVPGQLCDGYGIPQFNADGSPLKACDLHAPAHPKVPAEPGSDPGAAPVATPEAPVTAAPEVPSYPTESPRDPLAMLPVEELGLKRPVLELLKSRGVTLAGQLFDELGGDMLDVSEEQEAHIRAKILRWESERQTRIVADGSWLDEELTYACFRLGDAAEFWAGLRAQGATDAQMRDAINKRFFTMGGTDIMYRAGYYFFPGPAPEFFQGSRRPGSKAEPALSGQALIDRVRQLLQIPTREEPPAKGDGKAKASKQRKAVAR